MSAYKPVWLHLWVYWFLLVPTLIKASAVYNCGNWPFGLLQTAVIVDCADGALGPSNFVPFEVWRGSSKFLVDISRNGLEGPLNFSSPSNTIRTIIASGNQLTGSLPGSLPLQIKDFDISNNDFEGDLPSGWDSSTALRTINLRNNIRLTGLIPSTWGSLTKLELLDLRGTSITGEIPPSMKDLSRLSSLLVDGCNLTGCVPLGIPFPVPSIQVTGFELKQCTASPSQAPSIAPSTQKPSFSPSTRPSRTPSMSPTRSTRRPTNPDETESPLSVAAGEADVALGAGIGIAVAFVVLAGIAGSFFFWRSQRKAASSGIKTSRGESKLSSAVVTTASPTTPTLPPNPPSGPRPGRTFIPGRGWVQDKGQSSAPHQPVPPSAPPTPSTPRDEI